MSEVFYSNPGSDENKLQAKGRWHRPLAGPLRPVVIVDLLTPESIDAHLAERLAAKREFYNETLGVPWSPKDASDAGR